MEKSYLLCMLYTLMSERFRGLTQRSTIQFKLQILDGSGDPTLYFRGSALTAHSPTKGYLSIYF
jgi:hypothetical protein